MQPHRLFKLFWTPLIAWIPRLCLSAAQVPVLAAHIDLPGQPGMVKVTPDQSAAVVVASDGTGTVSEVGIALDLRKLSAPVVRAKFPLQGLATQFEVSPDSKSAMLLAQPFLKTSGKSIGVSSLYHISRSLLPESTN